MVKNNKFFEAEIGIFLEALSLNQKNLILIKKECMRTRYYSDGSQSRPILPTICCTLSTSTLVPLYVWCHCSEAWTIQSQMEVKLWKPSKFESSLSQFETLLSQFDS